MHVSDITIALAKSCSPRGAVLRQAVQFEIQELLRFPLEIIVIVHFRPHIRSLTL